MTDVTSFKKGIHFAHACSSMYFMERSTGLRPIHPQGGVRHLGGGYVTLEQQDEAKEAVKHTMARLNKSPLSL
jgi:hypothetical protein